MTTTQRTIERIKQTGEVFTPSTLVNEMLKHLPTEVWNDPLKTFLDPACGNGQFLAGAYQAKTAWLDRKKIETLNNEIVEISQTLNKRLKKSERKILQEELDRLTSEINKLTQTEAAIKYVAMGTIYGLDIMVDNVCDSIARMVFLYKTGKDIFNDDATPIEGVEGSLTKPHNDEHSLDWLKQHHHHVDAARTYTIGEDKCIVRPCKTIFYDDNLNEIRIVSLEEAFTIQRQTTVNEDPKKDQPDHFFGGFDLNKPTSSQKSKKNKDFTKDEQSQIRGFLFSYKWNDEEEKIYRNIICTNSLEFNVDVWDVVLG